MRCRVASCSAGTAAHLYRSGPSPDARSKEDVRRLTMALGFPRSHALADTSLGTFGIVVWSALILVSGGVLAVAMHVRSKDWLAMRAGATIGAVSHRQSRDSPRARGASVRRPCPPSCRRLAALRASASLPGCARRGSGDCTPMWASRLLSSARSGTRCFSATENVAPVGLRPVGAGGYRREGARVPFPFTRRGADAGDALGPPSNVDALRSSVRCLY
ncbi:hypothetical protein BH09MYX1_BH09MYX1_23360 [soil metagenome]